MPARAAIHRPAGSSQGRPLKRYAGPRLYDCAAWRKASKAFLLTHPLCVMCENEDPPRYVPSVVTDHIREHNGDLELFWDPENWQPLCLTHHNRKHKRIKRPPIDDI